MDRSHFIVLAAVIAISASQRSPYAGRRPIGFPVIETTTSANTQNDTLGNKFGEGQTTTTQRLPIEALGDRDLVNRLGQLPQDNQPFWFINWQAIEANRNRPQTFPLRPNVFIDPISPNTPLRSSSNSQPIPTTQDFLNNRASLDTQQPSQSDQAIVINTVSSDTQQPSRTTQAPSDVVSIITQQTTQSVPSLITPAEDNRGILNPQTLNKQVSRQNDQLRAVILR